MKKAFTLIELLVVVLIIGILSSIALPQYQKTVEKSRAAEAKIILKTISEAEERYVLAGGDVCGTYDLRDLDISIPGTYSDDGTEVSTKNFIFGLDECAAAEEKQSFSSNIYAKRIGKNYSIWFSGPNHVDYPDFQFFCNIDGIGDTGPNCSAAGAIKRGTYWFF